VDETDSFLGCKWLDGGGGSSVIDLSNEWAGYPENGEDLQMTISKDDAALIAAAPDMLEALERIRDESGPFNLGEMRKLVESAIRKARGEE
jgi:hypothetical protein